MSDERRRSNDALEAEIRNLAEVVRELKDEIKENHAGSIKRISDIEEEIWGFPKGKGLGLLQKVRDSNKKWTYVWAACVFLFALAGRIISPLYDKFVSDWVYNSPSQRYLRDSARPKMKNYKIYMKSEQAAAKAEDPNGRTN